MRGQAAPHAWKPCAAKPRRRCRGAGDAEIMGVVERYRRFRLRPPRYYMTIKPCAYLGVRP